MFNQLMPDKIFIFHLQTTFHFARNEKKSCKFTKNEGKKTTTYILTFLNFEHFLPKEMKITRKTS